MESVRAGTGSFILEEARTCYEFSRWADVTLISSSDCVAIKVRQAGWPLLSPPLTSHRNYLILRSTAWCWELPVPCYSPPWPRWDR